MGECDKRVSIDIQMYNNGAMAARNMTLDLNNGKVGNGNCKRARITVSASVAAPVLTTPDVQMLKMTSPELAKFLNAGHNVSTPTPFPKTVTEEQELYARGFERVSIEAGGHGTRGQRVPDQHGGGGIWRGGLLSGLVPRSAHACIIMLWMATPFRYLALG